MASTLPCDLSEAKTEAQVLDPRGATNLIRVAEILSRITTRLWCGPAESTKALRGRVEGVSPHCWGASIRCHQGLMSRFSGYEVKPRFLEVARSREKIYGSVGCKWQQQYRANQQYAECE